MHTSEDGARRGARSAARRVGRWVARWVCRTGTVSNPHLAGGGRLKVDGKSKPHSPTPTPQHDAPHPPHTSKTHAQAPNISTSGTSGVPVRRLELGAAEMAPINQEAKRRARHAMGPGRASSTKASTKVNTDRREEGQARRRSEGQGRGRAPGAEGRWRGQDGQDEEPVGLVPRYVDFPSPSSSALLLTRGGRGVRIRRGIS